MKRNNKTMPYAKSREKGWYLTLFDRQAWAGEAPPCDDDADAAVQADSSMPLCASLITFRTRIHTSDSETAPPP